MVGTDTLRKYVPGVLDDILFVNAAPGADKLR